MKKVFLIPVVSFLLSTFIASFSGHAQKAGGLFMLISKTQPEEWLSRIFTFTKPAGFTEYNSKIYFII